MDYSIQEVAKNMSTSIKVVRRWVASGDLKAFKHKGSLRISDADLNLFTHRKVIYAAPDERYLPFDGLEVKTLESKEKERSVNWINIDDVWQNPKKQDFTFVDLFCGAGGLSKGLEMAGLEGICGLDWFYEAGQTYRRNFKHPFVSGDIRLPEKKEEFYETVKKRLNGRHLNIIAGGFPCQGFSMAGNRIVDDPRNSLYKEMIEIVKKLQPDFVICENVKGLRSMLKGRVEQKILDDYQDIGYEMNVATLCAADYYTPQKRERVIFIGNRIGLKNYHPKPILKPSEYITVGEAIGDLINHPEDKNFNHEPTHHRADMIEKMKKLPEGQSLYKGYSDAWKKCFWNKPSCTIKENHGGVNIHPKLPRVLTAREMARLQSFPDDFVFMGNKSKQLVQIGNAVPPLLGKAIGLAIIKSYSEKENE